MSKYMRSFSEGDFLKSSSHDPYKILKQTSNLITLPKDMYRLFNEFQLTQSRNYPIKEYRYLVEEIRSFNIQLSRWKQGTGPQVKNLRMTYSFYDNLYSRIKYINSLSSDQQSAKNSLIQVTKWFQSQKPKVRGASNKKPQALLKPSQADLLQQIQLQDMTQFNMRKRQMKPYETMSRTAHSNFFPPKQRLLDYNKKQFILDPKLTINNEELRQTRIARTSSQNRTFFNETKMKQTSTTFRNTKATFKQTSVSAFNSHIKRPSISNQITEVKQHQNKDSQKLLKIKEFKIEQPLQINDDQGDKVVQQQEMINDLINQPHYQQDEKDDEQYLEQEPQKSKFKKNYQIDHKDKKLNNNVLAGEQRIKDQRQSTLRRLLQSKEAQLQHKLEDLNIKQNMLNWAKTASFHHKQMSRKSQSYRHANDFHKTEFKKQGFFQKRKEIPQFNLFSHRAKTAQQTAKTIAQSYQKRKIDGALKNFGRYIHSHVKINPISHESQQNDQIKLMRATSLTSFNRKSKRNNIGDILAANQADEYNNQAENQIVHLKDKLSKKLINVNKKKIHSALTAVKTQRLDDQNIFPKTLSLFSNPFFPKHLYEKKKKKKK